MVERGANMVVDRSAIILSTVDIDVTPVAVQRLDKALPHVKVDLTPVPAGAAPAARCCRCRHPGAPVRRLVFPAAAPPAKEISFGARSSISMADPRFYDSRGPFRLAEMLVVSRRSDLRTMLPRSSVIRMWRALNMRALNI